MTTRVLPVEEWNKLTGTLLESAWPSLDPHEAQILVTEEAGAIIACVALFRVWHLDGVWIAPAYRQRIRVGRHFLAAVRAWVRARRVREVWMMALNPRSARICRRMGRATPLPCEHFAVQMETP